MLHEVLIKLGLDEESAKVVDFLTVNKDATVLQLSRAVKINRTNLYRILDQLESEGYVVRSPRSKTTRYSAISSYFLKQKVDERRNEAMKVDELFEEMLPELQKIELAANYETRVKYYQGGEECKQLIWNSLKTSDLIRSFGYRSLKEAVGIKFLTEWFNESSRRMQSHLLLANPETFSIKEKADKDSKYKFVIRPMAQFYKKRSIPSKVLKISHESFIYDDVFAIVQWKGNDVNDVMGIEIKNQVIAEQQKDVFDVLWKLGKDVEH